MDQAKSSVMRTEQCDGGAAQWERPGAFRQARPSDHSGPVATDHRGNETILVIDDEEPMQRVVRRLLVGLGYQVILARNGEGALDASRQHEGPIHLILSDVHISSESGPALVQRLLCERPAAKVLFMSGHSADTVQQNQLLDPGASFIEKPFANDALARKVREVLDA